MVRRLLEILGWSKAVSAPSIPPTPTNYADLFELMRYDRGMDVMPYMIGFRPKPPLVDPTGAEPNFAILDTDAEVADFLTTLAGPILADSTGAVSVTPLLSWNDRPSALMAQLMVTSFYHPDDENAGWPFLQVFALPADAFASGAIRPHQTARGRYNFRQFPPEDKERYAIELHEARARKGGSDILIGGEVPFSVVDAFNPRRGKAETQ